MIRGLRGRWLGRVAGCAVWLGLQAWGCSDVTPETPASMTRVRTDRSYLRDEHGRYMYFQGVNTSGSTKVPFVDPQQGTFTYVGRPFPLDRARYEFSRMRKLGFNAIRLLVMWEGLEPKVRGEYDEDYLSYLREVVKIAGEFGIFVLMDMHQDMFSRHLTVRYNEDPTAGLSDPSQAAPGSLQHSLLSLVPPYTAEVKGDGAPKWVIKACMPEKDLDSPNWGIPRIASGMDEHRGELITLYKKLSGDDGTGSAEVPEWVQYLMDNLPPAFPPNQSTDMLPFTNWGVAAALSIDVERSFACLLAGDKAFPGLEVDGVNIKDYLQEAYAAAWAKVAERVADLPNVMGYDIMNEPEGNFLILAAEAAAIQLNAPGAAHDFILDRYKDDPETGEMLFNVIMALRLLPPDTEPETLRLWGLDKLDLMNIVSLNYGFDRNHLTPFYDRVGKAIVDKDPKAVIFIEPSMSASNLLGSVPGGMWDQSMVRPPSLPHVAFAPHNYADIYPFIGFNQQPRQLTVEEIRYRDYSPAITASRSLAEHSLGNAPVVFGEFGTYFNFNGIEQSKADGYAVSSHVLDNYYEAFDGMFQSRILWCHSPDNDYTYGDWWNHEDFSIVDPQGNLRSELAWARPFPRALAGKPVRMHFWSDYHFFDPDKGKQAPRREFELVYASKESDAPTEISIPEVQYPDGFYVWVDDGTCYYDHGAHVLYHYPQNDAPEATYTIRILPPLPHQPNDGWRYFFKGDEVVTR